MPAKSDNNLKKELSQFCISMKTQLWIFCIIQFNPLTQSEAQQLAPALWFPQPTPASNLFYYTVFAHALEPFLYISTVVLRKTKQCKKLRVNSINNNFNSLSKVDDLHLLGWRLTTIQKPYWNQPSMRAQSNQKPTVNAITMLTRNMWRRSVVLEQHATDRNITNAVQCMQCSVSMKNVI